MRRMGAIRWFFGAAFLWLLMAAGCTVKNTGKPHANQPPKVFFSTIPVSGTIFTKPDQFFWYATDRDGYITEFQYALQPDSLVGIARSGARADSAVRAFLLTHPVDTDTSWHWRTVDNLDSNGQKATIALPTASTSPSDTVTRNSVVFVRARDDRGLLSTASPNFPDSNTITYRLFGRKNRPPQTYFQSIGVCNKDVVASGLPTFYSLDYSTYDNNPFMRVGHCGITVRWTGADSLDYPDQPQPPLDYFWELFGPFPEASAAGAGDSTKLWASTTYPVRWPGPNAVPYQSPNRRTFTTATSTTFFGLSGADTLSDSFPGYYFFRVRARDDAGVIDSTGNRARFTFRVIHPRFDRRVLLIGKQPVDSQIFARGDGAPPNADSFKVQNSYLKLIRDAGYGSWVDSARDIRFYNRTQVIPESLLGRYQLVIFHKDFTYPSAGVTTMLASLKAYMDAGGSVWGMGRDDLTDLVTIFNTDQPQELPFDVSNPVNGAGYFYFGVEQLYFTAHTITIARDSMSREEFIGAEPLIAGFPVLDIDTNLVQSLPVASERKDTSRYRQLPAVNYFVRGPRSENLYLFRSPVGVADTSHLNGKVVAFRSDRRSFRTAYFGFPLYFIREPGATEVMRQMLEWFIGPP